MTTEDTLFHCLRKSLYAFKRIMDSTNSALATKVSIFQTYISSRWLWTAPAVFPTTYLLRKVESLRNTLLLSLLRLPTDELLDWVTNEVSGRRAVRHLCDKLPNMPQWGKQWLTRFWTYWGHAAREDHQSLIRTVIEEVQWFRIRRGYVRAAEVIDTDSRRIEKTYALFRPTGSYSAWFHAARDRQVWDILLNFWVAHWIGFGNLTVDCKHFMGKQLVAVDTLRASLRPSRAPPFDEPYTSAFPYIRISGSGKASFSFSTDTTIMGPL